MATMQHVDPAALSDLPTRVKYLQEFIGFTQEDAAALHAAKPVVAPLIPTILDVVYTKLLSFDVTAKPFTPAQTGQESAKAANLTDLDHEHPQIKFRKDFLKRYLVQIVSMDYTSPESWEYMDKVGKMHTGVAGFAHRAKLPALRVEYIHAGMLLGYVQDILLDAVLGHPDLDMQTKTVVLRAVNKILWIQNDLFARHYIPDASVEAVKDEPAKAAEPAKAEAEPKSPKSSFFHHFKF